MNFTVEFEVTPRLAPELERKANRALKVLLEQRHLYQATYIDAVAAACVSKQPVALGTTVADPTKKQLAVLTLVISFRAEDPNQVAASAQPTKAGLEVSLCVPTVMATCAWCKQVRPFNLVAATKVGPTLEPGREEQTSEDNISKPVDTFSLAYKCQACKGPEEVFLVRREGWKLTLCGRSPIELVTVPSYIPASVRGHYRSAVVARDSGEVLAGLFFLRVLVEQFTRPWGRGEKAVKAADVIDRYMDSLPDDFKGHFPSFRPIYEALSRAIHTADASENLFAETRAKIDEHFDARRLHRLPAPPSEPTGT